MMNATKSIVADLETWAKVETLAERKTISVSAFVRQAIKEKVEKELKSNKAN